MLKNLMLCILVAFLLLSGIASADFSPALEALLAPSPGNLHMTLSAGGTLTSCAILSAGSLAVINSLLSRIQLRFLLCGRPLCEVILDGKDIFTLSASGVEENALLAVASAVYSKPAETFAHSLQAISEVLEGWSVADSRSLSIKNAGTAARRVIYALSADEWDSVFPVVTTILRHAASQVLAGSPGLASSVDDYLSNLKAESKCTLKRFVMADGSNLGMEFTGRVSYAGQDVRNVTVFCGYSAGKGIYASVKCSAVKGKDSFALVLSGKYQSMEGKNTFNGNLSVSFVKEARKFSLTGSASFVNRLDGRAEQITGSITVDTSQTLDGLTDKRNYTMEPVLLATPGFLSGTLLLGLRTDKGQPVNGTLEVSMVSGVAEAALPPDAGQPLSDLLIDWLLQLPDNQALLLLHELAGERWMNGETIPQQADDPWVVGTEVIQ